MNDTKSNRKYYCNIIFCKSRLLKKYRFGDLFQIRPLPEKFQINYHKADHFPLIIEYYVNLSDVKPTNRKELEDVEKFFSEATLQNNWLHSLVRLLSVFTNHFFFVYDTEQSWYFPLNSNLANEIIDKMESSWGFKYYHIDGIQEQLQITQLTDTTEDDILKIKHIDYFMKPHIDDTHAEITISEFTDLMFESFTTLTIQEKKYFEASVTLIYNGQQIKNKMRSLAYLSFISSIETMTSYEFREKQADIELECKSCKRIKTSPFHCQECGNPTWGITQQFKEYLKKYLSDAPEANSIINKIYGVRSKIVHSGQLLLGDSFIDWDKDQKQNEEANGLISVMQYSKLSIIKWLILNGKEKAAANTVFMKK